MQENTKNDLAGYARHYDESKLWRKLSRMPRASLLLILERALLLRELLVDRNTPLWVRGVIAGALGYLILPIDLCPDPTPFTGLLDDAAMLGLVLANVDDFVTEGVRERASKRMGKVMPTTARGGQP